RAVAALARERGAGEPPAYRSLASALPGLGVAAARAGDRDVARSARGQPRVTLPAAQPRRNRLPAGAARGGPAPLRGSAAVRYRPADRTHDSGRGAAARPRRHGRDSHRGPLPRQVPGSRAGRASPSDRRALARGTIEPPRETYAHGPLVIAAEILLQRERV